jgi:hypothetical protein
LYLPAPHREHTLIPENEYVPLSHTLQFMLAFLSLKVPAGQITQVDAFTDE